MRRNDYTFPFRIDGASGQAAQSDYESHVDQMIRQILLTSPGERIDLPEFGCDLRRVLFAPNSDALAATTQMLILQALDKWLADQITVQQVAIERPEDDGSQLLVQIDYVLIETQTNKRAE